MNKETLNTKLAFKVKSGGAYSGAEKGEIVYFLDKTLYKTVENIDRYKTEENIDRVTNEKIVNHLYEYLFCKQKDGSFFVLLDEEYDHFLTETNIFIKDLTK